MSVRRPERSPRAVRAHVRASHSPVTTGTPWGNVSASHAVGRTVGRTTRRGAAVGTPHALFRRPLRPSEARRSTSRRRLTGVQRSRAGGGGRETGRRGRTRAPRRRGERRTACRAAARRAGLAGNTGAAGRPFPDRSGRCGGDELRAVGGRGGGGRAVPLRRARSRRQGEPGAADRADARDLARFRAGGAARTALRLPGARPLGPVDRRPLEPGEAAARPVRTRGRRRLRAAARGVRARPRLAGAARGGHRPRRPGLGAVRPEGGRGP